MSSSETKVVEGERAAPAQRATRLSRIVDWLTLRKELSRARSDDHGMQNEARRAQDIARTADLMLDPPDGTDRSPEVAIVLFREATHWLLQAVGPEVGDHPSLSDALASAREHAAPQAVEWLSAHPLPRAMAASRLEFAGYAAESQLAEARASQRWLHALLALVTAKHEAWRRLRVERVLRLGALAAVLCALFLFGGTSAFRAYRGPDLAAGKPWRASSSAYTCDPVQGMCGGRATEILFHTNEEAEPWFEIDLLASQQVGRVEVRNRIDAEQARAVPLILELSGDGKHYQSVAQMTEEFDTWNAVFPRQAARYVRLRVARTSILHLERVSVRR